MQLLELMITIGYNNKLKEVRIVKFVLFTDKATFYKNRHIDRHNIHYYADKNSNQQSI